MLVLRVEQMRALEEPQRRAYEDEVFAHVQRGFPEAVAELGPAACHERIRQGIALAQRYRIQGRQSARRFVELVFALGPDFDERLAWAKAVLEGPGTPSQRLDRVQARPRAKGRPR